MAENDIKSCLTSVLLYLIGLGIILLCFFVLGIWQERNPVKFCDELNQNKISKYNSQVCKLRYPILNTDEIKKTKNENRELKRKVSELEHRIEDIKDVTENGKLDNWQPDLIETEY